MIDLMFDKIKSFWATFWSSMKEAYNKAFKEPIREMTQDYSDTTKTNFMFIFINKLNSLVNTETTFAVDSDSAYTEPLDELMENLEDTRFEITAQMLAYGDYWCFPATREDGTVFHRFVPQQDVRILGMDGDMVTRLIAVIDKYNGSDGQTFFLCREHTLAGNTLTVETYTTDITHTRVAYEPWQKYEGIYRFTGVDNIGVGRFKSPISSREQSPIYGVPLNFGCLDIEGKIFNDLAMIDEEFANAKSKLFADPLILKKSVDSYTNINGKKISEGGWEIPENLFPIDTRSGQVGANIDIFSPAIRYTEFSSKLMDDMHTYEQIIGTDRGFLTPFENGSATTATEIRRANASTIALLDKIRNSLEKGINETIKADCILLNIRDDMYTVQIDWFDVFADENATYNRIREAVQDGAAEIIDQMQWLFPNLSAKEIDEKLERIRNEENDIPSPVNENPENADTQNKNFEVQDIQIEEKEK